MRRDFALNQIMRIEDVCACFQLTRDAWYKKQTREESKKSRNNKVINLVQQRRKVLPFEGIKKLHLSLSKPFKENGIKLGRDKLNGLLGAQGLLVKRRKKYARTTDSRHTFNRYSNLIKEMTPSRINQIWVADITYISTKSGFLYLSLITDAYSRKIVGYDVSDTLEMLGAERALKMALKQRKDNVETIHHSDHGVQYCCHQYTNRLKASNINISMGEIGNCYENAMAERVNGILKEEFKLDLKFNTKQIAIKAVSQAIYLYNNERLHSKIGYRTPESMYKFVA